MDPKELFPVLPEDLTQEERENLEALLDQFKDSARGIKNATADFGELEPEQVVEQYRAGVVAIRAIEEELKAREEGVEVFAQTLAEIDEGVDLGEEEKTEELTVEGTEELVVSNEDDPDPDPSDPDPDPEKETEIEETVVAAATPRRITLPAVPKQHRGLVAEMEEAGAAFVAAAGLPGIVGGSRLDRRGLAEAFIVGREQRTVLPEGFEDRMTIASLDYRDQFPESRRLDDDVANNMAKIDALFAENQVASGGLCAPFTPRYEITSYGDASRPVRDTLVTFNAGRGGINAAPGISIADIDDGVGVITADQDAGTSGVKSCLSITCPSFSETAVSAVYACIEFGNLNSRAWPELVERFLNELAAQHARVAETALLDGISTGSTAVTRALQYSGTSTILAGILQAVSAYRLRVRSAPEMRFRFLAPDWLPELLLNDLWNQQFGRWDITTEAGINARLSDAGVDVTYYLDTPTDATAAATFGAAQTAAAVHAFPDTVVTYLFPEGTFLFLDMGMLDLGIVRDSTLNSTNDYQIFSETFENVAFVGFQSLKITYTLTHSGELAPAGSYVA